MISNCNNEASVTGRENSGGIVGLGNTKGIFIECRNSGTISSDDDIGVSRAGGICRV